MDDSKTPDVPVSESSGDAAIGQADSGETEFEAAAFQQVDASGTSPNGTVNPNLEVILDVPVTLSLEVGRTEMSVGKLLRLSQGAVVELDRNAGEPLDVMVNGALVAHGEIVVINDKFGIRLIDVLARTDQTKAGRG
jgi:flagellar motor switch protein FliN/FliY